MADGAVELENVRATRETTDALLVNIGGRAYWIPKSQITDDSEVWEPNQVGTLVLTEWIAIQKGLA